MTEKRFLAEITEETVQEFEEYYGSDSDNLGKLSESLDKMLFFMGEKDYLMRDFIMDSASRYVFDHHMFFLYAAARTYDLIRREYEKTKDQHIPELTEGTLDSFSRDDKREVSAIVQENNHLLFSILDIVKKKDEKDTLNDGIACVYGLLRKQAESEIMEEIFGNIDSNQ